MFNPSPAHNAHRIGELVRRQAWLEAIYPINYHIYRSRWNAQPSGEEVGPRLEFLLGIWWCRNPMGWRGWRR